MSDETKGKKGEYSIVRGEVVTTSNNGVKIGENWYNYSQYDEVKHPAPGDEVELKISKGKWIKNVMFVSEPHKNPSTAAIDKQVIITRLALLNTATAILSTHEESTDPETVMNVARTLEQYVYGSPTGRPDRAEVEDEHEDIPTEIEDRPPSGDSRPGHQYHGHRVADARVKSMHTMLEPWGFKSTEDVKGFLHSSMGVLGVTCLHLWAMTSDNFQRFTKILNEYVQAEGYGKEGGNN